MSVKRYKLGDNGHLSPDPSGTWIHHADYAALESALKACVEALETTCHELHKAGGHVFASLGEDAIAAARSVLK